LIREGKIIWELVKRVELFKHDDAVHVFILISVYTKMFSFSSELEIGWICSRNKKN
jgi:hypothetical protein